jgi:hypothetical protein
MTADEFELFFDKGVTDGLPVVPPTRERVARMRAGAARRGDELLGEMPPNYGRVTVEKVAINAVMAGCRPEYLPVLIAAVQCVCAIPTSTSTACRPPPISRRRSSSSTAPSARASASMRALVCSDLATARTPPSGAPCACS